MNYDFNIKANLNRFLLAIKEKKEFLFIEKEHHYLINYVVSKNDTFENPNEYGISQEEKENRILRRECRGIIFNKNGEVVSRPYHKFFNINEKEETQTLNINLSKSHLILDKLDGSMIRPIYYENSGQFRYGTKMMLSDVALVAETFAVQNPNYKKMLTFLHEQNATPIFEWCSRKNRIVIDYPEDKLILTGVRNLYTGKYWSYESMQNICDNYNIPLVKAFGTTSDIQSFLEKVKSDKGVEGFIIRFDDGHMLKIKCDEYIMCHRSKDTIQKPRHIVSAILNQTIDDLRAFVTEEDRKIIDNIEKILFDEMNIIKNIYDNKFEYYYKKNDGDKKNFAINDAKLLDSQMRSVMFNMWKQDVNTLDLVMKIVEKATISDKDWSECVEYFGLSKNIFLEK